jgi:hypothetical protein
VVAVGSAELTESLGPQAIDNIPMGHYVFLLEFNGARKFGFLRPKKKRSDVLEQRLLVCVSHSNRKTYAAQGIVNILFSLS